MPDAPTPYHSPHSPPQPPCSPPSMTCSAHLVSVEAASKAVRHRHPVGAQPPHQRLQQRAVRGAPGGALRPPVVAAPPQTVRQALAGRAAGAQLLSNLVPLRGVGRSQVRGMNS